MVLLTLSRLLALGLAGLGIYTLHTFGESNGLFPRILEYREKNLLPVSVGSESFPSAFVGFDPLDGILKILLIFFWPLVNGESPDASLVSGLFVGQAFAVWTVVVLEGCRKANSGRLISFTTVYGCLVQLIGFAVVGPTYVLLYLFTSPLVTQSQALTPSALSIPDGILSGHPFGLVIGFLLPTVFMSLGAPETITTGSKITAILVWQAFPLWSTIYTYLWKTFLWPTIEYANESDRRASQLSLLRNVYKFALAIAVPAHIGTLALSLSSVCFPGLFTPAAIAQLHPVNAFVPPNPFDTSIKAASIAEGAKWFIQYDYLITSAAYLAFAVASRYLAQESKARDADTADTAVLGLLDVVVRTVILGPMATALTLIWDRDEEVFAKANEVAMRKKV